MIFMDDEQQRIDAQQYEEEYEDRIEDILEEET